MALAIRFWRDAASAPRANAGEPFQAVGAYLEQVVREDRELAEWLLESLDAVVSGREPEGQQINTGRSALTLEATTSTVFCEPNYPYLDGEPSPECVVETKSLREVLVGWLAFLQAPAEQSQ